MENLKAFKNPVYWSIIAGMTLALLFSFSTHLHMTYDKSTIQVAGQEYVKETTRWSGHTHTNYIPVEYALNYVGVRLFQRTNPLFRFYVERYHKRNTLILGIDYYLQIVYWHIDQTTVEQCLVKQITRTESTNRSNKLLNKQFVQKLLSH